MAIFKLIIETTDQVVDGKLIKAWGEIALRESKKCLALWNKFLLENGSFPSGKNENDAI